MKDLLSRLRLSPDPDTGGGGAVATETATDNAGAGGQGDGGPSEAAAPVLNTTAEGDDTPEPDPYERSVAAKAAPQANTNPFAADPGDETDTPEDDTTTETAATGPTETDIDRWAGAAGEQPVLGTEAKGEQAPATDPKAAAPAAEKTPEIKADQAPAFELPDFDADALTQTFADEFAPEVAEAVKPLIATAKATKAIANELVKAQATIAEQKTAMDRLTNFFREAPIHAAMEAIDGFDTARYGHFQSGDMSEKQYEQRQALEKKAHQIRQNAKAEKHEMSMKDAYAAAHGFFRRHNPANQAKDPAKAAAKQEVFKQARATSAQRTPAGLRNGVSAQAPAGAKRSGENAWLNKLDKAFAGT